MIKHLLTFFFIIPTCYAEIYQWKSESGTVSYSDKKPASTKYTTIQLKEPIPIQENINLNINESRIVSWEVTEHHESHINLAVKYFYDGKYNEKQIWLSAHTLDNGVRSMNYSVRPTKIINGEGIVNIRLGVSSRAPKRHCTNQIKFSMYGKNIPTFHEATVNFNKCWTNNYIPPTTSTPSKGIK